MKRKQCQRPSLFISTLWAILLIAAPAPEQFTQSKSAAPDKPPQTAEAFFKRGVARYQQGDLPGAQGDFNRAIELATRLSPGSANSANIGVVVPEAAALFYNRGVTRYDQRDWDGALLDFEETLKLDPLYVLGWVKLGNTQANRGELDAALKSYSRAIKLDPRCVLAWNNRGLVYQNKGEYDAALRDYAQALKLEPRLPSAYNNRGGIKHDRGDFEGALSDYGQAIALDPTLALVWNNRGVTHKALGDLQAALHDYSEAIRLRPDLGTAYFNRMAVWKALGKQAEALSDYQMIRGFLSDADEAPEPRLEPPLAGAQANKQKP